LDFVLECVGFALFVNVLIFEVALGTEERASDLAGGCEFAVPLDGAGRVILGFEGLDGLGLLILVVVDLGTTGLLVFALGCETEDREGIDGRLTEGLERDGDERGEDLTEVCGADAEGLEFADLLL